MTFDSPGMTIYYAFCSGGSFLDTLLVRPCSCCRYLGIRTR